jgi:hypothetical protein
MEVGMGSVTSVVADFRMGAGRASLAAAHAASAVPDARTATMCRKRRRLTGALRPLSVVVIPLREFSM